MSTELKLLSKYETNFALHQLEIFTDQQLSSTDLRCLIPQPLVGWLRSESSCRLSSDGQGRSVYLIEVKDVRAPLTPESQADTPVIV